MPFLADLDYPPPSRWKNFLIGTLVAVPLGLVLALLVIPALRAGLVGETAAFDERLRQEDAYMAGVCYDAFDLERDEGLCSCVLAVEFPSLDCRGPFNVWSIARQNEACAEPAQEEEAVSFCACVASLAQQIEELQEVEEQREVAARYAQCAELDDAFYLPEVSILAGEAPAPEPPGEAPSPEPAEAEALKR